MENKLIRITTTDSQCRFDGTINADLNISPESEIALKSLFIEKEEDQVSISPTKNTITYTFNDGIQDTDIIANLKNATYDQNNFSVLLDNIQAELNKGIPYDPNVYDSLLYGMEFQCALNKELKIQIEMGRAFIGPHEELFLEASSNDIVTVEETVQITSDVWYVDQVITNGKGRVMKLDERIPNGVGYLEAMIWKLAHDGTAPADYNSFFLCFSQVDLAQATPEEIADDLEQYIDSGIGVSTDGAGFSIVKIENINDQLVFTDEATTGAFPTEGQNGNIRLRLLRVANKISGVYQDGPSSPNSTEFPITTVGANQPLFPFIVFFTDEGQLKLAQIQCAISHFSREQTTPALTLESPIASSEDRKYPSKYIAPNGYLPSSGWTKVPFYGATNNKLVFEDITLANFLGYEFLARPRAGTVRNINFVAPAQVKFGPRIAVDELIILAENIELDSYDTFATTLNGSGQRRSILEVVGVDRTNEGKVVYNADFPNFISIRNKESRFMRNLKFRIVEKDYSTLKLFGQASMIVLIRSPKK